MWKLSVPRRVAPFERLDSAFENATLRLGEQKVTAEDSDALHLNPTEQHSALPLTVHFDATEIDFKEEVYLVVTAIPQFLKRQDVVFREVVGRQVYDIEIPRNLISLYGGLTGMEVTLTFCQELSTPHLALGRRTFRVLAENGGYSLCPTWMSDTKWKTVGFPAGTAWALAQPIDFTLNTEELSIWVHENLQQRLYHGDPSIRASFAKSMAVDIYFELLMNYSIEAAEEEVGGDNSLGGAVRNLATKLEVNLRKPLEQVSKTRAALQALVEIA
jgi:hypothetical protein